MRRAALLALALAACGDNARELEPPDAGADAFTLPPPGQPPSCPIALCPPDAGVAGPCPDLAPYCATGSWFCACDQEAGSCWCLGEPTVACACP